MDQIAYWIIGGIVLFVSGSILALRASPREKALGQLRDKAKAMGLTPRLVAAPEWTAHQRVDGTRGGMVPYYYMTLPEANLPLLQARVEDGKLNVRHGDRRFNSQELAILGAEAVEMQANAIGVYWNEDMDLHGTHLDAMKKALLNLAEQAQSSAQSS